MTECNTEAIKFSPLRRRQVVADFQGGRLTSDAGLLLLREVDRRLGLTKAISGCLHDPRDPLYVVHEQQTMLAQRIFAIAAGYEDLNDQSRLVGERSPNRRCGTIRRCRRRRAKCPSRRSRSPRPRRCVGWSSASPDSRSSRCRSCSSKCFSSRSSSRRRRSFWMWMRPTIRLASWRADGTRHGQQEGRFYHGYYRHDCFLPLYVFCGGHLLCALLRPANIDPAKHSRAIIKLLVDRIRVEWPEVKIIVRGDSGFCRWKFMRWCENHSVDYVFGIGRNKVLARRIAPLMAEAEAAFDETGEKQRLFDETEYQAKTWDRPRRVIMVEPVGERAEQGRTPARRPQPPLRDHQPRSTAAVRLRRVLHTSG